MVGSNITRTKSLEEGVLAFQNPGLVSQLVTSTDDFSLSDPTVLMAGAPSHNLGGLLSGSILPDGADRQSQVTWRDPHSAVLRGQCQARQGSEAAGDPMWHTGGQNQRVRALHQVTPWCQPWGFMEPAAHQQEGSWWGGTPGVPEGCMQDHCPIQQPE